MEKNNNVDLATGKKWIRNLHLTLVYIRCLAAFVYLDNLLYVNNVNENSKLKIPTRMKMRKSLTREMKPTETGAQRTEIAIFFINFPQNFGLKFRDL